MDRELKNQRISDDAFMKERAEVLQQWPTGQDRISAYEVWYIQGA